MVHIGIGLYFIKRKNERNVLEIINFLEKTAIKKTIKYTGKYMTSMLRRLSFMISGSHMAMQEFYTSF